MSSSQKEKCTLPLADSIFGPKKTQPLFFFSSLSVLNAAGCGSCLKPLHICFYGRGV